MQARGRVALTLLLAVMGVLARLHAAFADSNSPVPSATPTVAPIATNRPTIGDPATVMPPGVFQIETGPTYSGERDGSTIYSLPTEFRLGIVPDWEFRVEATPFSANGLQGIGNIAPGFKWNFGHGKTPVTLVGNVTSVGSAGLPVQTIQPQFQVLLCADVPSPHDAVLTLNVGANGLFDAVNNQHFTQADFDAYYTYPLNSTTGAFFETNVVGPDQAVAGINQITLDAGMTFLTGLDTQLDFIILKGMSNRNLNMGGSIGYSHRFR